MIVLLKNLEDQIEKIMTNSTVFSLIIKNAQKKYYSDLKKERKMLFNVSTVNIVYVEIYVFLMKI